MRHRTFRSAAVLAVVVLLAGAGIAFADTVPGDGDAVTPGDQNLIPLGVHRPGEVVTRDVSFRLLCGGGGHAPADSVISVFLSSATVPIGGAAVTATGTTIGPVPTTWPTGSDPCATPPQSVPSNGPATVTLTMPTIPGTGYRYSLLWAKTGATGIIGLTFLTFTADVVANTKPHLSLPTDQTIEATGPTGATATYSATATDAEDAIAPTPTCTPTSGSTFALGATTVNCTVTDSGGLSDTGSFHVTVVDTTPPNLVMPADITTEATGPGGASVSFAVSASDVVDGSVAVSCDHASGDTFALGTTTVNCSAQDGATNPAFGSFKVTVQDTTDPSLTGMPADMNLTTGNPAGTTLTYTQPGATDVVDPSPTVTCSPSSGSAIPVGATKVTCTATDGAGNHASASFTATVTYVSPVTWSAVWGEPVSSPGDTFSANGRRTIPIKVDIFANGVEQTRGQGMLSVAPCGGGDSMSLPLSWDGSRWTGHLDTSTLPGPGCYRVTASVDGHAAGSFRLDLRGGDVATTPPASTPTPKGKGKP